MPANTSDILLNSISSPQVSKRTDTRSESSQSFAEHWTLQSSNQPAKNRQASGREVAESRERIEQQQHRARSERHSGQQSEHAPSAQHAQARSRSGSEAEAASHARASTQSRNANVSNAETTSAERGLPGKDNKAPSGESVAKSGSAENSVAEHSSAQRNDANVSSQQELSNKEKFILGLLGVSTIEASAIHGSATEGADGSEVPSDGDQGNPSDSNPMGFIELLLSGGSSAKNLEGESDSATGEASTLESLNDVLGDEDHSVSMGADTLSQDPEADGDVVVDALASTVSPSASEKVSEWRSAISNEVKITGLGSASKSPLASDSALNPQQEAESEPSEGGEADMSPGEVIALNSKAKQTNVSVGGLLKEGLIGPVPKDISSSPSASGYGDAVGIQHSHAPGRASGVEHNFQLQRSADIQGRSSMQSELNQAQWKAEVAEKVAWFSARNISRAEIRLDPPELGSLQIKIQLNQDQAQVTINSPHASVREALDQTSARLREMFQEQGLDLGDVNVGGGDAQERSEEREEMAGLIDGDDVLETESAVQPQVRNLSLVDSYA
ncbi:flagellar hook-length control protein FliK [Pseudoteredinibacter isoporae]|uniref:flagellar hook-length control protein FliK n=1 Tax=Pseudoteredinibacter isoporae TaxID=570281 RepID=UPI003107DC56